MKKIIIFSVLAITAGCLATNVAAAQIQWTPEQKAVWKAETDQGNLWAKGDIQGGMSYFDNSFLNWGTHSPVPISKNLLEEIINYQMSQGDLLKFQRAVPTAIWVNGNYAYADYYSLSVYEDKSGKKTIERDRSLDVLLKKDSKWVIVGSLTADYAPGK